MDRSGICFMGLKDIAERAGISERSVRNARNLWEGPHPVFARSMPGETKGHLHSSYRYELVRRPAAFAAARDKIRHESPDSGSQK
jgi:hypothetical protein